MDAVASSLLRHRTRDNEELYGAKFGRVTDIVFEAEGKFPAGDSYGSLSQQTPPDSPCLCGATV